MMTKRLYIWGVSLVAALPCLGQYVVIGQVENTSGSKVMLIEHSPERTDTLGSTVDPEGRFRFEGNVSSPVATEIIVERTRLHVPVFLENGFEYKVKADVKTGEWNVEGGGSLQECRMKFKVLEDSLNLRKAAIMEDFQKRRSDYDDSYIWRTDRRWAIEKEERNFEPMIDRFISQNDNMVSASLITAKLENYMADKTLPSKYSLLGETAKKSVLGEIIRPKSELVSRIIVGGNAPDFSMPTPQGDTISLGSIKGKVKIIDFWASWCGPCRAENPTLKKLYAQYHDKGLEIISVSLDTDKNSWIAAIEKDGLGWIHVSELGRRNTARDKYLVWAIPQIYILDGDDIVLAEGLRGKALEDFIADKLGVVEL